MGETEFRPTFLRDMSYLLMLRKICFNKLLHPSGAKARRVSSFTVHAMNGVVIMEFQ